MLQIDKYEIIIDIINMYYEQHINAQNPMRPKITPPAIPTKILNPPNPIPNLKPPYHPNQPFQTLNLPHINPILSNKPIPNKKLTRSDFWNA